jgi:hypothetical protein
MTVMEQRDIRWREDDWHVSTDETGTHGASITTELSEQSIRITRQPY